MTKLGVTPGVHEPANVDEKEKEVETEKIKIDPKVFTVLQPTVIPMPALPKAAPKTPCAMVCKALIVFLLFTCCFTAGLVLIYGFDNLVSQPPTSTEAPKALDDVVVLSLPLNRVVEKAEEPRKVVDGSVEDKNEEDRPLHPFEVEPQTSPFEEVNVAWQRQMEARMMAQAMAMRLWRLRRIQQAMMEQRMMKEAMMRAAFFQQQQAQEEFARRQWAQAQFERAQWEQAQVAQQRQMQAQQQWQQQQQWEQSQAELAEAHARAQWQHQAQFWPRPMQVLNRPDVNGNNWFHQQPFQQPRPTFWQQPPQNNFFPQQQPQQQPQDAFPVAPQQNQPLRPHDASPQEIIDNMKPPMPAPQDRIYEQLQRKSQNIEFNAPTHQIWTAITPSPAAIAEDKKKEAETAAKNQEKDITDALLRDIFSAFDEQKNIQAQNAFKPFEAEKPVETTTANVFKNFEGEQPVETTTQNAFKPFDEQKPVETSTESVFKPFEGEAQKVEQPNVFKSFEEPKETSPAPAETPKTADDDEFAGAVVVEDSFPRIEARTTTPEPKAAAASAEHADDDADEDHERELDPFTAVLKYFEHEAKPVERPHSNEEPSDPIV